MCTVFMAVWVVVVIAVLMATIVILVKQRDE